MNDPGGHRSQRSAYLQDACGAWRRAERELTHRRIHLDPRSGRSAMQRPPQAPNQRYRCGFARRL